MNKWIPVTERLPEGPEYDWVLVQIVLLGREPFYGIPHVAELINGVWKTQGCDGPMEETLAVKVTHWMPLPDVPEEPVIVPGPEWMIRNYINNDVKQTEELFETFEKKCGPDDIKPEVFYICDRRACSECEPRCTHTRNIRHAINFGDIDGDSIEHRPLPRLEYIPFTKEPCRESRLQSIVKKLKGEK